jgi:predicted DNA-binding transcriptional regulator YafY
MATSSVFNITQKWRHGADIFSELSEDQVKVLLEALVAGTKLDKENVTNERLVAVSDWVQHVVERAGSQQLKPEKLQKEIEEYMDEEHQQYLLRYYSHFIQKLRSEADRSPVSPLHLDNVQWRVQFQLGQGDFNKVLEPSALVHFDLSAPEKQESSKESFTLEFDRDSLFRFYMQLEDLQDQLDDLG